MLRSLVALSSIVLTSALAHAEAAEPKASITFSPIHLIIPFGEVTAEINLGSKVAVSVLGGAGAVRDANTDQSIKLWELGLSPRYYVWGGFRHGVQLGVEAAYVHASEATSSIRVSAAGLAIGPYVGYKWIAQVGFTFEAQLGAQYLTLRGDSATTTTEQKKVAPLLNLQVGWSF